ALLVLPVRFALLLQLLLDDEDLEAGQAIQLELQDRVGLFFVQLEAADDLLRGVRLALALADDLQDLVEGVEDGLEAFQDVDAALQRPQLVLQAPRDDFHAEGQEVPEDLSEIEALRAPELRVLRGDQARQVDGEVRLEGSVLVKVREDLLLVGVLLEIDLDADVVRRDVPHVRDQGHLAGGDDLGDALDQRRLVHAVGDARDVDGLRAALLGAGFPGAADLEGALAGLVHLLDLLGGGHDLSTRREIRALHGPAELPGAELAALEQSVQEANGGQADLLRVVGRDVGRHAHRDARRSVDEEVREARGEDDGLLL